MTKLAADELAKLGAKTARDRLKEALQEALPSIKWFVHDVRICALVSASAGNVTLTDPQEPRRVLSVLEQTFPGIPWRVRVHYVEDLQPGVEPKISGSVSINLTDFPVSVSEAPPGIKRKKTGLCAGPCPSCPNVELRAAA